MKKTLLLIILITGLYPLWQLGAQEEAAPAYPDENSIVIEDAPQTAAAEEQGGPVLTFWDVLRMILVMAAVLLVIYLIFRFLKKAGGPRFQENDLITMHASLGLGGNRSLHLIEVGQEMFLVGAGENTVNLISRIEEKESLDELRFRISTEKEAPASNSFAGVFSKLFQRDKSEVNLTRTLSRNREFLKEQRERLKKL